MIYITNTCYKGSLQLIDASSMSCNVVAVWKPCFVQVVPAACLLMLLLSGDHASCGSCQQHFLEFCCYLETMLHAGRASSMSCTAQVNHKFNVTCVWRIFQKHYKMHCHMWTCNARVYDLMSVYIVCRDFSIAIIAHHHIIH